MPAAMERDAVLAVVAMAVPTIAIIAALVSWGFRGRRKEYERGFAEGHYAGVSEGWNRCARIWNDNNRKH